MKLEVSKKAKSLLLADFYAVSRNTCIKYIYSEKKLSNIQHTDNTILRTVRTMLFPFLCVMLVFCIFLHTRNTVLPTFTKLVVIFNLIYYTYIHSIVQKRYDVAVNILKVPRVENTALNQTLLPITCVLSLLSK